MDSAQADLFTEQLIIGSAVGGWTLHSRLGYGKSAVVMCGSKAGVVGAVKVFHPGLIERYGREAQVVRVSRELSLVGRQHPHLVEILDGGECSVTGNLYVAMEYVPGKVLSASLKEIPRQIIPALVEQLARAAKQLEDWEIIHRDIKPDNVQISNDISTLKLLDFGVLKPIGDDRATELQPSRGFIGTHQYSPPEMIHGEENQTVDGWRAITFYQLGAVLHDLIAREPLFDAAASRTQADLVRAIDHQQVSITAPDVDVKICNLAVRCLLKNPADRIKMVAWEDFFFSEHQRQGQGRTERIHSLARRMKFRDRAQDPLHQSEVARLRALRVAGATKQLREKFDRTLVALAPILPPRTTIALSDIHPRPALSTIFAGSQTDGMLESFHVQLSVEFQDQSHLVRVYARAGRGIEARELGWSLLGDYLEDFAAIEQDLEQWLLGVLEEMTD